MSAAAAVVALAACAFTLGVCGGAVWDRRRSPMRIWIECPTCEGIGNSGEGFRPVVCQDCAGFGRIEDHGDHEDRAHDARKRGAL